MSAPQTWTPEMEQTLVRMLKAGRTRNAIAQALGVSTRSVQGKMQRLGLTRSRDDAYDSAMRRAERAREKEQV